MNEISRIQSALRPHLNWHGARLSFLALFLVALLRVETGNLDKLASVFANRAQSDSNYKRLQAMLIGLWQHQQRPIPLKAHGRRAKSLCRYGCDFLRRTFSDFSLRRPYFNQALKLLSPY